MPEDLLPFAASVADYMTQVNTLLAGHRSGEAWALQAIHENHPRFLDAEVKWLPRPVQEGEIAAAVFDESDARLALARLYCFLDWEALVEFAGAVGDGESAVFRFESAVEAVVSGHTVRLRALLHDDPTLVHARSTRVTKFDPPRHRATLLHYVAANGVEGYRQKTPRNAVDVARVLLERGAEPNALANLYSGECTTMSLLVSSAHPAQAGLQVPLVDVLVDFGASVEPTGTSRWASPLLTALVFGYRDSAEALARRGARVDTLAKAAGLGRLTDVRTLLGAADAEERHAALAVAAVAGSAGAVRVLVDAGEDVNRFNPEGFHSHGTPLHHAACYGHLDVARVLVEAGARLDVRDTLWDATPLGWAEHCGKPEVAAYLREVGGPR